MYLAKRPMQVSHSFLFCILIAGFLLQTGCRTYDLRSHAKTPIAAQAQQASKAQAIIQACAVAHGWDQIGETPVEAKAVYTDSWPPALIRAMAHPWPTHKGKIEQTFTVQNLYTSEVNFLDGKKQGERWGLENQQAYRLHQGEKKYRKHTNTSFFLPTYQYFLTMPYWMLDIPVLEYAGETEYQGEKIDLVFGSWNQLGPQKLVDQYLFWINQETHLLERVEYTVRDQLQSVHGINTFSDFREVSGMIVPFQQTIGTGPDSDWVLHQLKLISISFQKGAASTQP